MINVAILPGWGGGSWHIKPFEESLLASGFAVTDPVRADVIIAHGTACYDLPQKTPAVLYVLIDPPYWPGKPIWRRFWEKITQDAKDLRRTRGIKFVIAKYFWGSVYGLSKINNAVLSVKSAGGLDFLDRAKGKNIWVIRNSEDVLCSPDIQLPLSGYKQAHLVNLPGKHDDFLTNSQPYIGLLPKQI